MSPEQKETLLWAVAKAARIPTPAAQWRDGTGGWQQERRAELTLMTDLPEGMPELSYPAGYPSGAVIQPRRATVRIEVQTLSADVAKAEAVKLSKRLQVLPEITDRLRAVDMAVQEELMVGDLERSHTNRVKDSLGLLDLAIIYTDLDPLDATDTVHTIDRVTGSVDLKDVDGTTKVVPFDVGRP